MPSTLEQSNESLKQASREWWTSHSQDYVDPGEVDHLGIRPGIEDHELLELLNKFDRNFMLDGYFAQPRGGAMFSGLLPKMIAGKKSIGGRMRTRGAHRVLMPIRCTGYSHRFSANVHRNYKTPNFFEGP